MFRRNAILPPVEAFSKQKMSFEVTVITRAAIMSLFLRFVLILKVCVLENISVLISKICPYFDLCPYFCFILLVEVLTPGT